MSVYFFDSSALVKRYVSEVGTVWVANITDIATGNRIHIVRITGVEVISAITRRARGKSISIASAAAAIALFQHDFFSNYVATEVTSSLVGVAMRLAERYALRGYDAIQLAAALDVDAYWVSLGMPGLMLVSADSDLNAAAMAEGLNIDDPKAHP
ncbi:MAG TPA: type II toxin-antitoxin system VapC family toxin [Blastocatellia bacterium]|nr:type II toxin-antitoxin system VapC family toxin [Blastocatellia bacterium]